MIRLRYTGSFGNAPKFYFEKSSIESMKKKGFEFANPEFKWLSVKDFVSGTDQWKTFDGKEWSSLNEFEIEARTWSVHKDLITPEYLRLSRRVSKIQKIETIPMLNTKKSTCLQDTSPLRSLTIPYSTGCQA